MFTKTKHNKIKTAAITLNLLLEDASELMKPQEYLFPPDFQKTSKILFPKNLNTYYD